MRWKITEENKDEQNIQKVNTNKIFEKPVSNHIRFVSAKIQTIKFVVWYLMFDNAWFIDSRNENQNKCFNPQYLLIFFLYFSFHSFSCFWIVINRFSDWIPRQSWSSSTNNLCFFDNSWDWWHQNQICYFQLCPQQKNIPRDTVGTHWPIWMLNLCFIRILLSNKKPFLYSFLYSYNKNEKREKITNWIHRFTGLCVVIFGSVSVSLSCD